MRGEGELVQLVGLNVFEVIFEGIYLIKDRFFEKGLVLEGKGV